jgi:hypothetical protein
MQHKLFPPVEQRSCGKQKMVMADLCEKFLMRAANGSYYFLSLVEMYTRSIFVFLIPYKQREAIMKHLLNFISDVQDATESKVQIFLSDGGEEFKNQLLAIELKKRRIRQITTLRNCPQSNGVVERLNLTIPDRVQPWWVESQLPVYLCHILVETAAYVINTLPQKKNNIVPKS